MTEQHPSVDAAPAAVVDYTERAREILVNFEALADPDNWGPDRLCADIAAALSAVASEHQAAAIRAFGKRVWSDGEEVAYQAGVSDTRARLQEPDVREAVARACFGPMNPVYDQRWAELPDGIHAGQIGLQDGKEAYRGYASAALTKIAEMLK